MHLHLRHALAEYDDISADFLHVPPPSFGRRLVSASVPGLSRLDADLQPLRAKLAAAHWVRRHLEDRLAGVDVVHFYSQNSALLALGHLGGTPWMVSTDSTNEFNGITLPYRSPGRYTPATIALTRRFEDPVIAGAHRVVAQSTWVAQALRDDYGRTDDIPVIPFGITAPPAPASWSKPPTPVITFVGNALAPKGGHALLRVFARLRHPAELVLVTREQVNPRPGLTVVNDLRPGDPRLSEILSRTTVLAIPSKTDTFGYASLEAMAHASPWSPRRSAPTPSW